MTPQDAPAAEPADASPEAPLSLIEAQLHLLGQLAEAGLQIAQALKREATGEAARTMPLGAIALAFSRVSRAVRLSIMLSAKLRADALRTGAEAAADPQAALAGDAPSLQDNDAPADSETVAAGTDDAAERADLAEDSGPESAETAERAEREGPERLDRPDREDFRHLLLLPPAQVIDIIRRDLGLPPGWPAQSSPPPSSPPPHAGEGDRQACPEPRRRAVEGALVAPEVRARAPSVAALGAAPRPPLLWGGDAKPRPIQPRERWRRPPDG